MNRIIKALTVFAGLVISIDILLMIINGTMIYVILTMLGFYLIALLAFKSSIWKKIKHWLNRIGKQRGKFNDKFTRGY